MHVPPVPANTEPASHEPTHEVMEEAAQWYALLRSGDASKRDHAHWQNWLTRHPTHQQAWQYVDSISQSFAPLQGTPDPQLTAHNLWNANLRIRHRRHIITGIAAFAGTGMMGWLGWRHTSLSTRAYALIANHTTHIGEIRAITLPDNTRLWLNTATAVNEDFTQTQRKLQLVTGEIFISTASDVTRPFVVDTPQGRMVALGTRFTVRRDGEETYLAVFEGAVQIQNDSLTTTIVTAGQQVRFTRTLTGQSEPVDQARQAWSRGILAAVDMSLDDVVKELRRYRRGHLGISPAIANLRVFGSFPLEDTDHALSMLADSLPVRLQQRFSWWISIEPQ